MREEGIEWGREVKRVRGRMGMKEKEEGSKTTSGGYIEGRESHRGTSEPSKRPTYGLPEEEEG